MSGRADSSVCTGAGPAYLLFTEARWPAESIPSRAAFHSDHCQQGTGSLSNLSLVWAALPKTLVKACDFIFLFSREHFLVGARVYAHETFHICSPHQGPQVSWADPAQSRWAVMGMRGSGGLADLPSLDPVQRPGSEQERDSRCPR